MNAWVLIKEGKHTELNELLRTGDICIPSADCTALLGHAASLVMPDCMTVLIAAGADCNAKNPVRHLSSLPPLLTARIERIYADVYICPRSAILHSSVFYPSTYPMVVFPGRGLIPWSRKRV